MLQIIIGLTDWLTHWWLTNCCLVNLIDVTLACEDAYSKLVEVVTVADVSDEDLEILKLTLNRDSEIEIFSRFVNCDLVIWTQPFVVPLAMFSNLGPSSNLRDWLIIFSVGVGGGRETSMWKIQLNSIKGSSRIIHSQCQSIWEQFVLWKENLVEC